MAKIVVIDDAREILTLMEHFLQSAGHEVILAEDGEIGLSRCIQHHPDIVFTDINMPGIGGEEVIDQLEHFLWKTKIIIITSDKRDEFSSFSDSNEKIEATVIHKPLNKEQVLEVVDSVLLNKAG